MSHSAIQDGVDAIRAIEPWPELRPLQRSEDKLPKLSNATASGILPTLFANYVIDVASRISVGPEFVVAPLLAVLGGIVGRRIGLKPKKLDNWTVFPCCLWSCISAPPGSRKSPILGEVRKFADRLDDDAANDFVAQRKNADSKLQSLAQRRKAIEKKLMLAHENDNDSAEILNLETALTILATDIEKATPRQRRFLTSDSTSAKLAEIMVDNPGGLIVFRDELDGLIQSFEQMGNENLRSFYIEAWDGKGRITQDRVSAGTRRAKGVAATLLGSTQPDKLARIVSGSEDGLIQRFGLLVCMPDQDLEERDETPNIGAFEAICRFCQAVSKLEGEMPLELRFDDVARARFKSWNTENGQLMRSPSTPAALRSHLAKYPSLFCGLATLFHLASKFEKTNILESGEVDEISTAMAERWVTGVLLPHARFVYGKNVAQAAAEKLSLRIQAGEVSDGMTVRALERKGWEGLSNSGLVNCALEELEEIGWLRVQSVKGTMGRSSKKIQLNPKLIGVGNAKII